MSAAEGTPPIGAVLEPLPLLEVRERVEAAPPLIHIFDKPDLSGVAFCGWRPTGGSIRYGDDLSRAECVVCVDIARRSGTIL